MDSFKRAFLVCDDAVRAHLEVTKRVVAVGRSADITEIGDAREGGTARSYVMITDRKLRWVPLYYDLQHETSLNLDDIAGYSERTRDHRWAIMLQHPSVEHPRRGQQGSCLPIGQGNSATKADCEINPTPSRSRSSRLAVGRRPPPGHSATL